MAHPSRQHLQNAMDAVDGGDLSTAQSHIGKAFRSITHPGSASSQGAAPPNQSEDSPMASQKQPAHWIQGAIKHPGALHRELGVPQGKSIPDAKIEQAEDSKNPTLAARARLAERLKGMKK